MYWLLLAPLAAYALPASPVQISASSTAIVHGAPTEVHLEGGTPGETARLAISRATTGPRWCPPSLLGECTDLRAPAAVQATGVFNSEGRARIALSLGARAALGPVAVQVLVGPGGAVEGTDVLHLRVLSPHGDRDADGLDNLREIRLGTDPMDHDSDDDGMSDLEEDDWNGRCDPDARPYGVGCWLDPNNPDSDGDLCPDGVDPMPDWADRDEDGLDDCAEVSLGTDDGRADTDRDGVNDGDEVHVYSTNPLVVDTDGDGLRDGVEVMLGLLPLQVDSDGDGLGDGEEILRFGCNPLEVDTDGGGLDDATEVSSGSDPADPSDDGLGVSGPGYAPGTLVISELWTYIPADPFDFYAPFVEIYNPGDGPVLLDDVSLSLQTGTTVRSVSFHGDVVLPGGGVAYRYDSAAEVSLCHFYGGGICPVPTRCEPTCVHRFLYGTAPDALRLYRGGVVVDEVGVWDTPADGTVWDTSLDPVAHFVRLPGATTPRGTQADPADWDFRRLPASIDPNSWEAWDWWEYEGAAALADMGVAP